MKMLKKLFINVLAIVMLSAACLGLTACGEDVRTVEVTVQVYDYENEQTKNVTLNVDLYGHLAPETVDAIAAYIEEGFYHDAIFYQLDGSNKQIMMGEFKFDNGLVQNKTADGKLKPQIKGEFTNNGVKGTNLKNERGYIGLWRSSFASDDGFNTSSDARDSGRATWYMPTDTISSYENALCVFAKIDLTDTDNSDAFELIEAAYGEKATITEYEVYYTGEFNAEKVDENYGLTFNCVEEDDFVEDDIENLFEAEGLQYTSFNHYTVKVATYGEDNAPAVKVVSAIIK